MKRFYPMTKCCLVLTLIFTLSLAGFSNGKVAKPTAATKAALLQVLTRPKGENPPAFLFSATHGLGWPLDDPNQAAACGRHLARCGIHARGVVVGGLAAAQDDMAVLVAVGRYDRRVPGFRHRQEVMG